MPVASAMADSQARRTLIHGIHAEAELLKSKLGRDRVCDFSLGNPDLPPPPEFHRALLEIASEKDLRHGYMPNEGRLEAREAMALRLGREQGTVIKKDHVIMTAGSAAALNVAIKALLDPGEEMVVLAPYFADYRYYAANHGVRVVVAPTTERYRPDAAAIEAALGPRTGAVLVNSPNNPTGQVYTAAECREIGEVLHRASRKRNRRIYLIADEAYRRLVYDPHGMPPILAAYPHTLLAGSFSHDLSLAGERIGFLAVGPDAEDAGEIVRSCAAANRILGFINAPGLMQLVVARLQNLKLDLSVHVRRRNIMAGGLADLGYEFVPAQGGFFFFPRSPLPDDTAFCELLKKELIMVVPGSSFGGPGHFRIFFCVSENVIYRSLEGFARALEKAGVQDRIILKGSG